MQYIFRYSKCMLLATFVAGVVTSRTVGYPDKMSLKKCDTDKMPQDEMPPGQKLPP